MLVHLTLSRTQIVRFRRRAGCLDERLPKLGPGSLRRAAWAGLQDSMPRAALLSLHARVVGVESTALEHSSLVQLWGPRFNNYVVAAGDLPVFSLGRLPDDAPRRERAQDLASRLHALLGNRELPFGEAGRALGVVPNSLRYAAATGRVLIRWDGAKQPLIRTIPAPAADPFRARLELARRYLHVFGPGTAASFGDWAGILPTEARSALEALAGELIPVRTPLQTGWMLAEDEAAIRAPADHPAPARLLPSGDSFYLAWGAHRDLLVGDPKRRAALWTSRVWPGALLVKGELAGVWRRAGGAVSIEPWRRLTAAERAAVETEALTLPLPGLDTPITIGWA